MWGSLGPGPKDIRMSVNPQGIINFFRILMSLNNANPPEPPIRDVNPRPAHPPGKPPPTIVDGEFRDLT